MRLLLAGTVLGTVVGVLAGAWTALRQYRISDRAVTLAEQDTPMGGGGVLVTGSVVTVGEARVLLRAGPG